MEAIVHAAKAPACEVGRTARAFRGCSQGHPLVEQAARVHETHGERDSQRLFRKHNLVLKVPISTLTVKARVEESEPVECPYLKISDYFQLLVRQHPKLLLAGLPKGTQSEKLLENFWDQYELFHPDHIAFEAYSREDRRRLVPICVHGDKGRGVQKSPCFVFSWQTPFGVPERIRQQASRNERFKTQRAQKRQVHGGRLKWSCAQRAEASKFLPGNPLPVEHDTCPLHQPSRGLPYDVEHNGKGNSLLSRFLFTAIPNKTLKKNPDVVTEVLKEMAENIRDLFYIGVQGPDGLPYRAAIIGCKGDFEFLHLDAGRFTRHYLHEGRVNARPMCPECHAGMRDFPSTDMSDIPAWTSTVHIDEPWDELPPLNRAPFANTHPVTLYRKDMFHTLKYGFCRDLAASLLIYLCQLSYFDRPECPSKALDARLVRAYSYFSLWCQAEGRTPTLKKFSLAGFHRKKASSFPWLPGKGADTILALMFLDFYLQMCTAHMRDPSHACVLSAARETVRGALDFTGVLHSHKIFLTLSCAQFLHVSGMKLLRGYHFLADRCISEGRKLFSLRPKCHYFHHMLWELERQILARHEAILSPIIWNCENDEDFIGRLSRLSRRVSPKIATKRVIDRYLVGAKLLFRRAGV